MGNFKTLTFSLHNKLRRQIMELAYKEGKNQSELIREAIRLYMERKEREKDFEVFDAIRLKNRQFSSEEIEQDVQKAVKVVRTDK